MANDNDRKDNDWIATTFGHGMTKKAKDERQTAKMETAFFYRFPITTFGNDEKRGKRIYFLWIATEFFQNSSQ